MGLVAWEGEICKNGERVGFQEGEAVAFGRGVVIVFLEAGDEVSVGERADVLAFAGRGVHGFGSIEAGEDFAGLVEGVEESFGAGDDEVRVNEFEVADFGFECGSGDFASVGIEEDDCWGFFAAGGCGEKAG